MATMIVAREVIVIVVTATGSTVTVATVTVATVRVATVGGSGGVFWYLWRQG